MDLMGFKKPEEAPRAFIRTLWESPADTVMAPMQDVLGLGADARMNSPGTMGEHNWSWRMRAEALNAYVSDHLKDLTHIYRRL